jgi:hypothetical protein
MNQSHLGTQDGTTDRYGVGDFLETDLGSFRLRPDPFPGYLGPFDSMLFQIFFLGTRYAELMRGALVVRKADAEHADKFR